MRRVISYWYSEGQDVISMMVARGEGGLGCVAVWMMIARGCAPLVKLPKGMVNPRTRWYDGRPAHHAGNSRRQERRDEVHLSNSAVGSTALAAFNLLIHRDLNGLGLLRKDDAVSSTTLAALNFLVGRHIDAGWRGGGGGEEDSGERVHCLDWVGWLRGR